MPTRRSKKASANPGLRGPQGPSKEPTAGADSLADAVLAALARPAGSGPAPTASRLELVADALVAKAAGGDVQAIKAVFDRVTDQRAGAAPTKTGPKTIEILHTFKSRI